MAQKSSIYSSMDLILDLFARIRNEDCIVMILAGYQPSFQVFLWAFYKLLEMKNNDSCNRMDASFASAFHKDNTGLVETLNIFLRGTGME